jgi:hypothetical protein
MKSVRFHPEAEAEMIDAAILEDKFHGFFSHE